MLLLGIGISVGVITPQLAGAVAPPGGYWCTISGYLLDSYAGNAPIKYARVYFSSGGYATTNANGYYSKSIDIGQPTGMWVTVSTSPSGYYSQTKSRYCEPGGSYSLPFHFGRKLTFTGYVKSNGQALASAPVKAYYKTGGAYTYKAGGSTNANGYYSLSFIVYAPCEEYRVIAVPTQYHWEGASSTWSFSHTFDLKYAPPLQDTDWVYPTLSTGKGQTVRNWAVNLFQDEWLNQGLEYAIKQTASAIWYWAGGEGSIYSYAAYYDWKSYPGGLPPDLTLAADYHQISTRLAEGDANCYNRMVLLDAAIQSLANAGKFEGLNVQGVAGAAFGQAISHFWVQGGYWDASNLCQQWFWVDAWSDGPAWVSWSGAWIERPTLFHGYSALITAANYYDHISDDLGYLFVEHTANDNDPPPGYELPTEPDWFHEIYSS